MRKNGDLSFSFDGRASNMDVIIGFRLEGVGRHGPEIDRHAPSLNRPYDCAKRRVAAVFRAFDRGPFDLTADLRPFRLRHRSRIQGCRGLDLEGGHPDTREEQTRQDTTSCRFVFHFQHA